MGDTISGVTVAGLKRFPDKRGVVMPIMKATDPAFTGFAEVYCSSIYPGKVKGWHMSENTTVHYVVVKGMIRLVLYDERTHSETRGVIQEIHIGEHNYVRVSIPPGIWRGFQCLGNETALLCDVIDTPPDENIGHRMDCEDSHIPYAWGK
jgi:dTDP-4-dehydrorhamnose 3,5-epimerase